MPQQGQPANPYGPPLGQWFTPDQRDKGFIGVWNSITKEEFDFEEILNTPSMTYFNRPFAVPEVRCEYDQRFHIDHTVDVKSKREDRHNLDIVRDHIHDEEADRAIPLCTSQNYGHRKTNLEGHAIAYHKRQAVMKELLRRNKINVKPFKKFPPEGGFPQL